MYTFVNLCFVPFCYMFVSNCCWMESTFLCYLCLLDDHTERVNNNTCGLVSLFFIVDLYVLSCAPVHLLLCNSLLLFVKNMGGAKYCPADVSLVIFVVKMTK